MNCDEIRAALKRGKDEAEVRAHVRECDGCFEAAVAADPDFLFRGVGRAGEEPPGGTDAFVEGVMRQVRLREAERRIVRRPLRVSPGIGWAAAAALTLGVLIAGLAQRGTSPAPVMPQPIAVTAAILDRPVVERYDSAEATIIELPLEETNDIRLVMVFDESLPADL